MHTHTYTHSHHVHLPLLPVNLALSAKQKQTLHSTHSLRSHIVSCGQKAFFATELSNRYRKAASAGGNLSDFFGDSNSKPVWLSLSLSLILSACRILGFNFGIVASCYFPCLTVHSLFERVAFVWLKTSQTAVSAALFVFDLCCRF